MTQNETQAIVTLSLMAAFVDGHKHDRERAEVKRIADALAQSDAVHLPTLVQDVLMKRVDLARTAATLRSAESRQLAYEMAVCVCDADGVQSVPEQQFLADLRQALQLDAGQARQFTEDAEAVAAAPIDGPMPAVGARGPKVSEQELDEIILNAAITNGALELLPETLSTMAIIPLQMRLVYRIGQAYGYELDAGHAKDFLATLGVGLTSQYLEQAQALLRRWPHAVHADAQGCLRHPLQRSAGPAGTLPASDAAAGADDGRGQGAGDGARQGVRGRQRGAKVNRVHSPVPFHTP
ncbi:MAG: hypothetical protein K0S57_1537 [Ramlibacter sp.]|nr:hypothetical protein [Ramlibacter sp.]